MPPIYSTNYQNQDHQFCLFSNQQLSLYSLYATHPSLINLSDNRACSLYRVYLYAARSKRLWVHETNLPYMSTTLRAANKKKHGDPLRHANRTPELKKFWHLEDPDGSSSRLLGIRKQRGSETRGFRGKCGVNHIRRRMRGSKLDIILAISPSELKQVKCQTIYGWNCSLSTSRQDRRGRRHYWSN